MENATRNVDKRSTPASEYDDGEELGDDEWYAEHHY